jgi:hypothetical protein
MKALFFMDGDYMGKLSTAEDAEALRIQTLHHGGTEDTEGRFDLTSPLRGAASNRPVCLSVRSVLCGRDILSGLGARGSLLATRGSAS